MNPHPNFLSLIKRVISGTLLFVLLGACVFDIAHAEYVGLTVKPANPRSDNRRTESIFIHTLNPGEVKNEGIEVKNNHPSETKTVYVFPADYTPSSGGGFACKQRGETQTDVATWITMEKTEIVLGPLSSAVVPFVINVPITASVGENDACVIVQEKKAPTTGVVAGAALSFRTAVRVAITIPGDIIKKIEIQDLNTDISSDGQVLIQPHIRNVGNVSVDAQVKVVTKDMFGGITKTDKGTFIVLRGSTSDLSFKFPTPFWGGFYTSELTVGYSDAIAEIGAKNMDPNVTLGPVYVKFFAMPSTMGMLIEIGAAVLVVALIVLWCVSRSRMKKIHSTWIETTVGQGDTIMNIAKKHNISWKLIAKVNNLKSPYVVEPGAKIKTPPHA